MELLLARSPAVWTEGKMQEDAHLYRLFYAVWADPKLVTTSATLKAPIAAIPLNICTFHI
jgi:hypothetical protein